MWSPVRRPPVARAGAGARPVRPRRCRAASARPAPSGSSRRWCCSSCRSSRCPPKRWRALVNQVDSAVLRQFAGLRSEWLTDLADGIDRVGSGWTVSVIGFALLLALVVLRRWRHLFTFLGATMVIEMLADVLYRWSRRPRPYDVTIIGRWDGWSFFAAPIAVVALLGVAISYTLVVAGRGRQIAKAVTAVAVAVFVCAELYLGTFHPSDMLVGVTVTVAFLVNAFRFFTPNEVFPVAYRQGKTAHLDVGGRRGEAIRERRPGPARSHRDRGQAVRSRGIGRFDTAAHPRRRRSRHVPLREALRDEPRARRPLVQARAHAAVRPARGRSAVPVGAHVWWSTRTTRSA